MGRLYFRIYLAVLGSLAVFAILAGLTWRLFVDLDRFGSQSELYVAAADQLAPSATLSVDAQTAALARWRDLSGFDLALFTRTGQVIAEASDGTLAQMIAPDLLEGSSRRHGRHWAHVVQLSDGRWLVAARPRAERSQWWRFRWLAALMAIATVVGLCAYPVVRRLTRRLEVLQSTVAALGSGKLSARVAVDGNDEVARLAETFNRSAERIETLVTANRSLLANASHELRSPLARLRMGIEALPAPTGDAGRIELARNIKELDQLIEEILLSSRLDAQHTDKAVLETVDIVALIAEECARNGAELTVTSADMADVRADPRLLRRLIRNLLENGQRHAAGATVEVIISSRVPQQISIDVCDRGPGVPADERERIFEPFYRIPGSREQDGGVGLGLSLVRQIAGRHGGTVICLPRDGGGTCFRIELPQTG